MNHCHAQKIWILVLALLLPLNAHARPRKKRLEDWARDVRSATASTPQDEEVCFAPDEPCDAKLVKFIDSAKTSLDLAIYDINLDELVHHLLVKAKTIPVRMVVDRKQAKGRHSAVPVLLRAGIALRFGHQRGIMHDKFVIVDGKAVETGSFNYTHHAAFANNENQVYLFSPKVVKRYTERFAKLWREARRPIL